MPRWSGKFRMEGFPGDVGPGERHGSIGSDLISGAVLWEPGSTAWQATGTQGGLHCSCQGKQGSAAAHGSSLPAPEHRGAHCMAVSSPWGIQCWAVSNPQVLNPCEGQPHVFLTDQCSLRTETEVPSINSATRTKSSEFWWMPLQTRKSKQILITYFVKFSASSGNPVLWNQEQLRVQVISKGMSTSSSHVFPKSLFKY